MTGFCLNTSHIWAFRLARDFTIMATLSIHAKFVGIHKTTTILHRTSRGQFIKSSEVELLRKV